ncbi:MAG: hypothetical protein ACT4PZ_23615 [Panacagrimonas sp.]
MKTRHRPGFVFIGVVIFPVLAWLGYNYFDQPLDPGAKALLEVPAESVPDGENLFLAMLALPIAGDEPAHERGGSALAAYEAARKRGPTPRTYAEALDRPMAAFDEGGVRLCSAGNKEGAYGCLRSSVEQRAGIEALLVRYWPLVERYQALGAYPRYSDPMTPTADAPTANAIAFLISRLELSALALAATDGASDAAAGGLARSAEVWRVVLATRDVSLIDKLMASRAVEAHTLLASEFIRSLPLEASGLAAIENLLRPLSETERSLTGPLGKEFRFQSATWTALLDPSSEAARSDFPETPAWWFRMLAKPKASINLSYVDIQRVLAVEQTGCSAIRTAVEDANLRPAPTASDLPWQAYLYNPMGRILQTTGGSADVYLGYLGRQCNLLALQGMVGLQLELRRAGLGLESTEAAVGSSHFKDPNTGKPFVYDTAAKALSFEFIGKHQEFLSPLPLRGP